MSTTPSAAARSARCIYAVESQRASTAAPEELHRSCTIPRSGTPRWSQTGGETTQSLQNPRDVRPARRSSFRLPAMVLLPLEARWKLLICQHTSGIVRGADSRFSRGDGALHHGSWLCESPRAGSHGRFCPPAFGLWSALRAAGGIEKSIRPHESVPSQRQHQADSVTNKRQAQARVFNSPGMEKWRLHGR